jgi:hypothetical protein
MVTNIYNDCTGDFPYMLLDGNICFSVMYHYKTNAILITPIAGLDFEPILEAYKSNFEYLASKGFKPKVNVMENQATKPLKLTSPHSKSCYNWSSPTVTSHPNYQKPIHRRPWHHR